MDEERPDSGHTEASAATHSGACLKVAETEAVSSVAPNTRVRMLLDSGSFMQVCPPTFAPEIPLRKDDLRLHAVTANGQPLRCYGRKR
eukprot:11997448-Heterocapsa_arctica.AAC.1